MPVLETLTCYSEVMPSLNEPRDRLHIQFVRLVPTSRVFIIELFFMIMSRDSHHGKT